MLITAACQEALDHGRYYPPVPPPRKVYWHSVGAVTNRRCSLNGRVVGTHIVVSCALAMAAWALRNMAKVKAKG